VLLYTGATRLTELARVWMAFTSAMVRSEELDCRPLCENPKFCMADTVTRLEPSAWNWLSTWACAPLPTATREMTAATPITMPNMVKTVRITWTVKEFSATRNTIASFFMVECSLPPAQLP